MAQTSSATGLSRLAERFAAQLPERLDALEEVTRKISVGSDNSKAIASIEHIVHNFSGSAPVFGYTELGAHAMQAEDLVIAMSKGETPSDENTLGQLKTMIFQLREHARNDELND
ncbi:Hpt domain-containing protein [Henriciella sp.]|uniref:Hpt domain-containing protein n=1 Tax=Henriciella sp. TaxID=1968823 RepID=UPI002603DFFF|nr:Hpt domain-containing protein [Henriciella sp.]